MEPFALSSSSEMHFGTSQRVPLLQWFASTECDRVEVASTKVFCCVGAQVLSEFWLGGADTWFGAPGFRRSLRWSRTCLVRELSI